jgi:hypothetical protein
MEDNLAGREEVAEIEVPLHSMKENKETPTSFDIHRSGRDEDNRNLQRSEIGFRGDQGANASEQGLLTLPNSHYK